MRRLGVEARAGEAVDRVGDPHRGLEIGVLQLENQHPARPEGARRFELDDRPVGDPPGRGDALAVGLGRARRRGARHRDGALRHRMGLAVATHHRRHDQGPAEERGRVAQRRHGDVERLAAPRQRRQLGGDDDGRDVAVAQRDVADVDAHAVEHRLDGLLGEGRVAHRVARAEQAHHEAVADELVLAHAAERRDVLDADGGPGRHRGAEQRRGGQQGQDEAAHQPAPPLDATWTAPSPPIVPATVRPLSRLRTGMTSPTAPACSAEP